MSEVPAKSKAASRPPHSKGAAKNGDTFKKLRVMVLCHEDLVPPDSIDDLTAKEVAPFKTEWDVISTLKKMGHEVSPVGVYNNLGVIGNAFSKPNRTSLSICSKSFMAIHSTTSTWSAISS